MRIFQFLIIINYIRKSFEKQNEHKQPKQTKRIVLFKEFGVDYDNHCV